VHLEIGCGSQSGHGGKSGFGDLRHFAHK
jgi:hypothetical protein